MLQSRLICYLVSAGVGLLFTIAPAAAQSPGQPSAPRPENPVRVQSTLSFFVAAASDDSEEAQKLRDRANRLVYETAGRQCDLLRETLAKDCRLESVNTNISSRQGSFRLQQLQQPEGFTVNASMSFQITLKQK